jgi:Tol biopolymer transport system component
MKADGSDQRRVLDTKGADTYSNARWSADGASIYFNGVATGPERIQIFRLHIASGDIEPIGDDGQSDNSSFVVSHDGGTIAFLGRRAPGGIFLMDTDGSDVRHIAGTVPDEGPVSWAPDGV